MSRHLYITPVRRCLPAANKHKSPGRLASLLWLQFVFRVRYILPLGVHPFHEWGPVSEEECSPSALKKSDLHQSRSIMPSESRTQDTFGSANDDLVADGCITAAGWCDRPTGTAGRDVSVHHIQSFRVPPTTA